MCSDLYKGRATYFRTSEFLAAAGADKFAVRRFLRGFWPLVLRCILDGIALRARADFALA